MKNMKVSFIRKMLIIVILALFVVVFQHVDVYATDNVFTLDKEKVDVYLNGSTRISYTGGTGDITWESSDTSVATVENGKVSGIKIGTATITATRGEEKATCIVNVVYKTITIGGNAYKSVSNVNLVLKEHDSENLYATVEDDYYEVVSNAEVKWSSSDTSIVAVDESSGTITAVKAGKATITATAAGVSDTCEVTVANAPVFTDFSNAKYELLFDYNVDLKISGVTPNVDNNYYYIITPNDIKPTIATTSYGSLDTDKMAEVNHLSLNEKENYMFTTSGYVDKQVELNQDLYLWVIELVDLEATYAKNEENSYISCSTKLVVEGEKLVRPKLPQLNLILQSLSIYGREKDLNQEEEYKGSYLNFRFPTATENRKFKLKIGKVTDKSILQKIQNNNYSGITELLNYAKNNDGVYTADLITTSRCSYISKNALFDGISLLEHKAYYYIYAEFDDEDGKYYPIEGITLGQAYISSSRDFWDICAYTADNFEWNDLSTTPTEPEKELEKEDETIAPGKLPNAGSKTFIIISVFVLLAVIGLICYKKYSWFKKIN